MTRKISWIALGLAAAGAACKGGAPSFINAEDFADGREVAVGRTLQLMFAAVDPDGDSLNYGFDVPNLPDARGTVSMAPIAGGKQAVFSFTPVASQVGLHPFTFHVTDGKNRTKLPVEINVRGATGAETEPIFRKPSALGIPLDLRRNPCLKLEILVEDADSTEITLGVEPPIPLGSELNAAPNGLEGTWTWCPQGEQQCASCFAKVTLSADDGENDPVLLPLTVHVSHGGVCEGTPPSIEHEPTDFNTLAQLRITAQVSDDEPLSDPPALSYSFEDPIVGGLPDLDKMTPVPMELVEGDVWAASVPNPTADQGIGAQAPLYYLIAAADADNCLTESPPQGVHQVTVTNSGGNGGPVCTECTANSQCGTVNDKCIKLASGNYCGDGCASSESCPSGFECLTAVTVEGESSSQCAPSSGTCTGGQACVDDSFEDNDSLNQAHPLSGGQLSAILCGSDPDWYVFGSPANGTFSVQVTTNGQAPNLRLYDGDAQLIDQDTSGLSPLIATGEGLPAGDYFIQVEPNGNERLDYSLSRTTSMANNCCEVSSNPGCSDTAIRDCVCEYEPNCCSDSWLSECVNIVNLCAPDPCSAFDDDHDCCEADPFPRCNDNAVEECVCAGALYTCCTDSWSQECVTEAVDYCLLQC